MKKLYDTNAYTINRYGTARCRLLILMILCLTLSLSGCWSNDDTSEADGNYDFSYSDRDLDASYDESSATVITLSDDGITVTGDGASADDGESVLHISEEGTYILSGSLSDGQIAVETPDDEKVQLVLKGVDITCTDDAPLLITESDKVFVTLAEGSENTFTGPDTFNSASADDGIDGVIFSRADLCINGSGSLTVTAASENGIVSKDDLIITGGTFDISAPGDAIQGKDCVKIKDGTFTVTADEDGIKSNNDEDSDRGFVSIDGGTFAITAGYDGIQAETMLRIAGGSFDITTGGGSQYSSSEDSWGESWGGGMGMPGEAPDGAPGFDTETESSGSSSDSASAKGIKGCLAILIEDGDINIDSSDDAVHSNGDITIKNGSLKLLSGDDGMHADSDLVINGGSITVEKSYEGLEGNTITIGGGSINVTASDDGLNAAGGNDSSSTDGRAGQNDFAADETAFIEITGGSLTISASGDGIDSNGDLTVSGGEIYLSGPVSGGDGALDYNGNGEITGGSVILAGSSGMAMNFGSDSSQCSLMYGFSSAQNADSEVSLINSSGDVLLSYSPAKSYSSVIFSCAEMQIGEAYTICVDGTEIESVTLSETVMSQGTGGINADGPGGAGGGGDIPSDMGDMQKPGGRK